MARTYKRDSRGRFAGGGGGSSSRGGGRKPLQRGTNRLTRDNAGRITSVGGDGATARGGRLRTASGKQRATVTTKLKGAGGRLRGGSGSGVKRSGKGKAPQSKLGGASSSQYKYNKSGQLATATERAKMFARDRRREKNALLQDQQSAGRIRAERRAARAVEQGRFPVQAFSSTASAARSALNRRAKRASENFGAGAELSRRVSSLTQKAKKIEAKAAERQAAGKPITAAMQREHASLRSQIMKAQRSLSTRKKAIDVIGQTRNRMESNVRSRFSSNYF